VQTTLNFLATAGEKMSQWRAKAQDAERDDGQHDDDGGHGPFGRHGHGRGPDRDMPGVTPEFNDARRDLKAAIVEALDEGSEDGQRRVADILKKAAELIRRRNVDLG
jgi:hypothetical protein